MGCSVTGSSSLFRVENPMPAIDFAAARRQRGLVEVRTLSD